jgi:hypothetical protein
MNNLTKTYTLNFDNLSLQHGDFLKKDDWFDQISEYGGYSNDCQYMAFKCGDVEVVVDFELTFSGCVHYDAGDWYTPPYSEVEYRDVTIDVTALHVDEWEVELTKDMKSILAVEIKKHL